MADNQLLFKRTYEIVIGQPSSGEGLKIVGDEDRNEGLDISFTIKKSLDNKEEPNKATLKIINLSEQSINFIKKEDIKIILKVGYGGDNKIIFMGDVSEIDTSQKGSGTSLDRETTIKCVPDSTLMYVPDISKTFPANTSAKDILQYLTRQGSTISQASFNSENIKKPFPFGYTIQGTPKEILDDLARDFNFTYRIDDRRLYVSDPNSYNTKGEKNKALLISPTTGLIGSVTYQSPDGKKIKKNPTKKDGIKFSSLLNPTIQPGVAVKLETEEGDANGVYRVDTAEYKGKWRSGNGGWVVECSCSIL